MKKRTFLSTPYLVWMIGFIIIPLVIIFQYALTDQDGGFTISNLLAMFNAIHLKAFIFSLEIALLCTVICIAIAYPLVMILKRLHLGRKGFVFFVLILPMWMNFLLRTLAWQTLLEKNGVINQVLHFFHLPTLQLINTPYAIVLGMVYNFLPFMVLPLYNVLSKIDKDVISAARDLGATELYTFRKIIFPLSIPGVVSGIIMVFVPALTTFVISDLLGGSKILLIGNVIEQKFKQGSNWNVGSGLSLVLMVFILISMVITTKYDKNGEGGMF